MQLDMNYMEDLKIQPRTVRKYLKDGCHFMHSVAIVIGNVTVDIGLKRIV